MKRGSIFLLFFFLTASLYAEEVSRFADKEIPEINLSTTELEGKAKAGIALGYPFGVTFGYRLANYLEMNVFAGSHFENDFTLGSSFLFTLANINIKDEMFPLSAGPAVYTVFGKDFGIAAGLSVRWEYTFNEAPVNLYIEGTPGIQLIDDFDFFMSASLGIRYVF